MSEPRSCQAPARLLVELRPVPELDRQERRELRELMARWFENVTEASFERDLDEKRWVVVARDSRSGELGGFSTLTTLAARDGDKRWNALYSGDTIVDPQWWRSSEFFQGWIRHTLSLAERFLERPAYWLLLSSGFRTYRLLPTFFRRYAPACGRQDLGEFLPPLAALARDRFGSAYDPATGIVRLSHPTPLRRGVSDITPERLSNRHVQYFVQRNPEHRAGDELVCLTELAVENLTRAGLRMVGATGNASRSRFATRLGREPTA
ncbi:MAG: hypothetical protein JNG90_15390 [Planctomycetaceae bacterium]|nr:hypothetical protein [Planctomycetaceae bacterium]